MIRPTLPRPAAALRAAAQIRALGRRRPGARHYACGHCAVTWAGPHTACWVCHRPALTEYTSPAAALQLLARLPGPTEATS
ncbi:hypothetical protein [Actinacidiphila yeochonensis]|uniref:hypothetical protein n=1 Tax=Actinacidiphila yeochonensis TaxID=89050 RepID=UPI000568E800|nr:hypothetical protein [Actinacidiphila yeochonensis]